MMSFTEEFEQRCSEWSDIVDHMPRLHAEACRYENPIIVDLGVRSGNSTCAFLAATEKVGGMVWSVDMERAQVPDHWFAADQWTFVQADDLWVAHEAPRCEVLFIDTMHTYLQTCRELVAYVPKVKPGGVILMHDTELEHVLDEAPFPVLRALQEFAERFELDVEWVSGCNGLAVIRV
jgi:hypothetical protein